MRGNVLFKNRKQNTRVKFSKSNWTYALLGLHDFILKVSQDKAFAFLRENSFLILNNFWILSADFNGKSLQKVGGEWKDLDSPGADFVSEIVPWARTSDFPSIFPLFPSHLSQLIKRKTSNYVTETIFMVKQQDFSTEQMIKDTYFHTSYLSFFLHWQNFWKIKFTPKTPIFCVKSVKKRHFFA